MNMQFLHLIWEHSTPVEGTFSIVALVSVFVSVYALRDAMIDSSVLAAAKVNGPRRMIADNNIHQEQIRLAVSGVMLLAAITFLFLEPPPPDYLMLPQSLVGLIAWILVSTMCMISSFLDKSVRKNLQKYAPIEVQTESVTVAVDPAGISTTPGDIVKAAHDAREAVSAAEEKKAMADAAGRRTADKLETPTTDRRGTGNGGVTPISERRK